MFNSKNFGSLHSPYHAKNIIFFNGRKMVPGPNLRLTLIFSYDIGYGNDWEDTQRL